MSKLSIALKKPIANHLLLPNNRSASMSWRLCL